MTLQPGTVYYYRVVATNADGTTYGEEQSFATESFPTAFAIPATPALLPFTSIAEIEKPKKQRKTRNWGVRKPLTRAQSSRKR